MSTRHRLPLAVLVAVLAIGAMGGLTLSTIKSTASAPLWSLRINAGGPALTDASGNHWNADEYYVGGRTSTTTHSIANTSTPALYQSERYDMSAYNIPVPASGIYTLHLRFAEIYFTSPGQRIFKVTAQGTTVVPNLDLVKAIGPDTAYNVTVPVRVTGGVLHLRFSASVNYAKISAIEVDATSGGAAPTSTPAPTAKPTTTPTSTPKPSPTPTATATPTATPTPAGGWFTISGHTILDPTGKVFIPVGDNVNGKDWVWNEPTIGESAVAQNVWHWNAIRLNTCEEGVDNQVCGGFDGVPTDGWSTNNDLTAIVNEYTARHIVVILDNLHAPNLDGTYCTSQAACNAYWKTEAAQYANNPYVWFELQNEPGQATIEHTGAGVDPNWYPTQTAMAAAVRSVAPHNIIVMDGDNYGQDGSFNGCGALDLANSAAYQDGANVESNYGNVVLAFHAYASTSNNCTAAQTDSRIQGYVNAVHSKGVPLIDDEMGYNPSGSGGSGTQSAVDGIYRNAQALGLGVLPFTGDAGGSYDQMADTDDSWYQVTNTSQLAAQGLLLWNYAHAINP